MAKGELIKTLIFSFIMVLVWGLLCLSPNKYPLFGALLSLIFTCFGTISFLSTLEVGTKLKLYTISFPFIYLIAFLTVIRDEWASDIIFHPMICNFLLLGVILYFYNHILTYFKQSFFFLLFFILTYGFFIMPAKNDSIENEAFENTLIYEKDKSLQPLLTNDLNLSKNKNHETKPKIFVAWILSCPPCKKLKADLKKQNINLSGDFDIKYIYVPFKSTRIKPTQDEKELISASYTDDHEFLSNEMKIESFPTIIFADSANKVKFHMSGYDENTIPTMLEAINSKFK